MRSAVLISKTHLPATLPARNNQEGLKPEQVDLSLSSGVLHIFGMFQFMKSVLASQEDLHGAIVGLLALQQTFCLNDTNPLVDLGSREA